MMELVFCGLCTASAATGTGQHQSRIPPDRISTAIEVNLATMDVAPFTFCLPKFATTFLLLRLLQPRRAVVTFLYFILSSLILCCVLFGIFIWVQCSPVRKAWNPSAPGACWAPSAIGDFAMFTGGASGPGDVASASLMSDPPQHTPPSSTSSSPSTRPPYC